MWGFISRFTQRVSLLAIQTLIAQTKGSKMLKLAINGLTTTKILQIRTFWFDLFLILPDACFIANYADDSTPFSEDNVIRDI